MPLKPLEPMATTPNGQDPSLSDVDAQTVLGAPRGGPETSRARELARAVHDLRATLHLMVEAFEERLDGRLAGVERALGGRGQAGRFASAPSDELLDAVAALLRDRKVQPTKGRVKDLVRLKQLTDELRAILDRD